MRLFRRTTASSISSSKSARATGRYNVKVLPWPGMLSTVTAPPNRWAISRVMDRPSPVPPYLRLVVPSACWNAPKIVSSCCCGMPIPVSLTRNATTGPPRYTPDGTSRSAAGSIRSSTPPCSVNFTAFDSRLRRI